MNLTVQVITTFRLTNFNEENDIELIGHFNNGAEALKFVVNNKPDIILLDYKIEKSNTELFVKYLLNESPESKVILLGDNLSDDIVLSCLVNAIYGYLEWQNVEKYLNKAILSVGKGEAWVTRRVVGLLIEKLRD